MYGYYSIVENHMEKLMENERKAGIVYGIRILGGSGGIYKNMQSTLWLWV